MIRRACLCAALITLLLGVPGCTAQGGPAEGALAPDFVLPGLDGRVRKLSNYRGQVGVIAVEAHVAGSHIDHRMDNFSLRAPPAGPGFRYSKASSDGFEYGDELPLVRDLLVAWFERQEGTLEAADFDSGEENSRASRE